MKRLFLYSTLLLFLFAVSSCSHDVEKPSVKAAEGEWKWVYSDGGWGDTLAPASNTLLTLSLNQDSTYVFYLNSDPQVSGNYSMQLATNTRLLYFDHDVQIGILELRPKQAILQWDDNELQLFDFDITDGRSHHFKKVQ